MIILVKPPLSLYFQSLLGNNEEKRTESPPLAQQEDLGVEVRNGTIGL